MDFTNVTLKGRLTRAPELRVLTGGMIVCEFGVASNKVILSKGEKKDKPVFVDVTVWGKTGERCDEYLKKGSNITLVGELKFDKWEKDGEEKSKLSITANIITFDDPKDKNKPKNDTKDEPFNSGEAREKAKFDDNFDIDGDSIPF